MNRRIQLAGLLLAAITSVSLGAQPGAVAPVAAVPAAASSKSLPWPSRLPMASGLKPETLARMGTDWSPTGTIEPQDPPLMAVHLGTRQSQAVAKSQQQDWKIIQERLTQKAGDLNPVFEKPGGYIYVPSDEEPTGAASSRAALMFRFISARPGGAPDDRGVTVERTWFALYDPLPPRTPPGDPPAEVLPTRGLVVVLPGMFGTPVDQIVGMVRRLRQEGYCVLRMMSQPSRFTETVTYALPFEGDVSGVVPQIAADLADRAAEAAYAVEAAVLYAQQERPELQKLPRAAIGMSGGAMLLPVVLSRDPSAWAGAVSIAGGVDYLRILTTSNYADWINAVRVKWIGQAAEAASAPPAARLEEISKAYRLAAPLDSSNLVPALKTLPWLLLHADADKAVPASSGDELWQLLGKPERITVKGGHEWIFMTLGGRHNAIAEWLNKRIPAPRPEPVQ